MQVAQIAAERIIMHLESRGFVLMAKEPRAPKRK
jgi:hypothetical protein